MSLKCTLGLHTWEGNQCKECGKTRNGHVLKKNWHIARSKNKLITQFVFTASVSSVAETDFGFFILPYDNFPIVSSEPWCTGLVRLGNKPNPFQIVRVGEFAEKVKSMDITLAFSLCKLPTSGIFLMDARIDNEQITNDIRSKYPYLAPIKKPVAEWLVSMGDNYSVQMLKDILATEQYLLVVAENSTSTNHVYFPNGQSKESIAPQAHHDRNVKLDQELRNSILKELNNLIAYHQTIPASEMDFNRAMQDLGDLLPLNEDPIFAMN